MLSSILPECDTTGKLRSQWSVLLSHRESLLPELESVTIEHSCFRAKESAHKSEQYNHATHVQTFEKKGFFEQMFSVNERKRMETNSKRLEENQRKIETELQLIKSKVDSILGRLARLAREFESLGQDILKGATAALAENYAALENHEEVTIKAKSNVEALKWLDDKELMLWQVLDICLNALKVDIESLTSPSPVEDATKPSQVVTA
jgi:hypothetical protein